MAANIAGDTPSPDRGGANPPARQSGTAFAKSGFKRKRGKSPGAFEFFGIS